MVSSSKFYKEKCEGPLSGTVKDPKLTDPKDILQLHVKFSNGKAFNKTSTLKFESKEDKGAFEDCKQLFQDGKEDLATSISELDRTDFNKFSTKTPDFNSWPSVVISYQTCIDGFPENSKLKKDVKTLFKDYKEFITNSLAIVKRVGSFLATFQSTGGCLLYENSVSIVSSLDKEGYPEWISPEDTRILKAVDDKPTPNVTVAKDGSGDFRTISEALAKIPEKYEGRYVVFVKE